MAAPRNNSYSAASGQGVFAGLQSLNPPAWRLAMPLRTWAEIGSNTMNDLDPRYNPAMNPVFPSAPEWWGPLGSPHSNAVSAWNGGVWDDSRLEYHNGPGGGHGNYGGNENYIWRGWQAVPSFYIPKPPSAAIGYELPPGKFLVDDEATGMYADGRVRSYHTYGNFAVRGTDLWFFGGSSAFSGVGPNRYWRWSRALNDWVDESGVVFDGNVATGAVYDSARDLFWIVGGAASGLHSFNPITKVRLNYNPGMVVSRNYGMPVYLPTKDGIVVFKSDSSNTGPRFIYLQLQGAAGIASPTPQSAITPTVTGTPPPDPPNTAPFRGSGIWGVAYDSDNARILVWWGGTTIYVLTPPADPLTGTWAWSTITPLSGAVNPGDPTELGVYNRFWYSSRMKACGVFNSTFQKMHVFALENL